MGRMIVTTGRGGTGKTTFAALAARLLSPPLLLIDIDPDQSLADMMGVDLEKEGVRTVLDMLFDIQKKRGYEDVASMPLVDKIRFLFNSECLYESKRFDIISLGVKWSKGCYCAPNNLLREIIPRIGEDYSNVIIDSPAGLEHLNRRVASEVDDIFIILDPSFKSLKNIDRIKRLTRELNITYKNYYLVTNYRFTPDMEDLVRSADGIYLGRIEKDPDVEQFNLQGRSLMDLKEDSPALSSVRKILEKAGYQII